MTDDGPTIIAPVAFRGVGRAPGPRKSPWRVIRNLLMVVIIAVLAGAGWFVLTARQIELTFDPPAERVEIEGPQPRFRISGNHLLRPGEYRVLATRTGYYPLDTTFIVGAGQDRQVQFVFEKLPGRLELRVAGADAPDVALTEVDVEIDGDIADDAPGDGVELTPGAHRLVLRSPRYQALETEVDIFGEGRTQQLALTLRPDWADVTIATSPVAAEVWVDGRRLATTPCTIDLDTGTHEVELRADKFETWVRRLEIVAETPVVMNDIVLDPARGRLVITTRPPGAQVTVDGVYVGTSTLETEVPPDRDLEVQVARDGYEPAVEIVRVGPGASVDVGVTLVPQTGLVRFEVEPADATLLVDGVDRGPVPAELSFPAVTHEFEFRKEGFVSALRTVRPRPDFPQRVTVELAPIVRSLPEQPLAVTAANGYDLKLVRPGQYVMGASRRERGRRSNETLRSVRLERPFYMGVREVTNDEFRAFRADHQSGAFETARLDGKTQPAVQVTWDDAARFCNWLSAQDRLPPAYVERAGVMEAVQPIPHGYRLPTEAEWEYCARVDGSGGLLKYPWGDGFPPPVPAAQTSGNYADESAAQLLALTIAEYDDGHAAAAPVASFDANARDLHDLGGNVAEWCHDFYSIAPYDERRIDVDPAGPETGRHHVIRGSSWRHSSISELRFSYRDYGAEARDDLGFRICRYLTSPEESP